uniref:Protein NLP-37 n=2 Tax=Haemonchus contortus TaxID=6289 RepID=W6NDV9_HAECO
MHIIWRWCVENRMRPSSITTLCPYRFHPLQTQMISRALFTVLFAVSAISSANQQRRMETTPSGYNSYQDKPYSRTLLSLYRKLHDGLISKRNNAEVVNHILKNFGTLDRLGDVGK